MAAMNPEQWAEVKRLFMAAAELRPEELSDYLQRECPDPDVRREVASLLDYSGTEIASADAAIASAAADMAQQADPDERLVGTRLGPYRVEAIAGHGGMGAVYRASRDDAEFRQQVAIKLVRVAAESPDTLRRFRQERQILARLSHPNIARLLDGGSTPEGVPYLVMEFIEGEPITAWCDRQSLGTQARLRLFLQVCEGVEFAQRDLVVHRDLKPANILVTKDGTPKLLDFGIAKLLDPAAGNEAATLTGLPVMTPDYASPEQVRGEPVSTAADVYSLGLILYEMLTGKQAQPVSGRTPEAIAGVVCQTEPVPPARLKPQLAGDLDNIILMAIRKEPARRYASAGLLARDIQRHLEGRPVTARRDTLRYRSAKFLRRNRIGVVAGLLIAASLAAGLVMESWLSPWAPRALQVVQISQTGRVEAGAGIATDGARVYFTERSAGQWRIAQVSTKGGPSQLLAVTPSLSQPDVMDISPDRSQLLILTGIVKERSLWVLPAAGGSARRTGDVTGHAAAWSPDGKRIVFARGAALFLVDADGTNTRKLLDAPQEIVPDSLRWGPAGGPDVLRLALIARNAKVGVLWEVAPNGAGLHPLLRGWTNGAAWPETDSSGRWFPSGKYYLFRSRRGKVSAVWALRENRSWMPWFDPRPVQLYSSPLDFSNLAPSPDGKRVFFPAVQERVEWVRYDAPRGQFSPYLSGIAGRWIDYSPGGRWLAYTAFPDGSLWRCRPDGSDRVQLTSAPLRVFQPHWSPDGTRIAFAGSRPGGNTQVYTISVTESGAGVPEAITSAPFTADDPAWSPDGNSLVFVRGLPVGAGGRAGLYIMDWKTRKTEFVPGSEAVFGPAWSPDARHIAAGSWSHMLLFDVHTRQSTTLATGTALNSACWSHDGKYVYYQDTLAGGEQPIFRVRLADRQVARVVTSREILQSNVTGYTLIALAPGDVPIALVEHRNVDMYALDVELP
jgi:Tol biopolymer transport system component